MGAEISGIASPIRVAVDVRPPQVPTGESIVIKPAGGNSQLKVVDNGAGVQISPSIRIDVTYSPRRATNPLLAVAESLKPQPTTGLVIDIKV
ncbi:MAG: hypothetical protein Q7S88_01590 [Candidatus Daviesbacteria bacterium]|nr:hypothetical protein [Candidatus Daviesbacteria bacterium]